MDILAAIFRDLLYRFWLFLRYRDSNIRQQHWEAFKDPNELHWTFWIVPGIIGFALIVLFIPDYALGM
jgi:hypothetical protein